MLLLGMTVFVDQESIKFNKFAILMMSYSVEDCETKMVHYIIPSLCSIKSTEIRE